MTVGLILAAAGSGSRLGGVPKQIRPLCGRPVISWSLSRFRGLVDEIVVVTSDDLITVMEALLKLEAATVPIKVVSGGATRLHSVACGIGALSQTVDQVLVHDAARPLVRPRDIAACIEALNTQPATVLASPCHATAKRCHSGGHKIDHTVAREDLWLAQTPQAFHRDLGEAAFQQAIATISADPLRIKDFTDDMSVLAAANIPAVVIPGSGTNIKITGQDDWDMAEALLNWEFQNIE